MGKFTLYLTLLFLMSSLYLTTQFNSIGNIAISVLVLMVFPIAILTMKKKFKVHASSLVLMYGFLIACGISSFFNADLKLLISGGMVFVLYLSAQTILPSYEEIDINSIVYRAILWSQIPIILIPLLMRGLDTAPYRGIFYNPNSFGTIAATLFVAIFSLFIYKVEMIITSTSKKTNSRQILLQGLLLFLLFFLVVLSGSRTSALAAGIAIIAGLVFLTIRLIKARKFWSALIKGTFTSVLGFIFVTLLVKFTPFYNYFYLNILYKFERKAGSGDILDHRGSVWTQTIHDAGVFGKGSSYFVTQTSATGHNTFITILGENGWIALIFFVLFLLTAALASFRYAISDIKDKHKYLPLMLFICFLLLSMGESMFFKLSMIAMFFSFGSTMDLKKRLIILNEEKPSTPKVVKKDRKSMLLGSNYNR